MRDEPPWLDRAIGRLFWVALVTLFAAWAVTIVTGSR